MNFIKKKSLYVILGIFFIFVLIVIDQISKAAAVANLKDGTTVWIIKNVLCLHYLENTGAAFSILEGKRTFFLIITPIVSALVFYIYLKMYGLKKFGPLQIICIFIVAGAIGNYIDRLKYAYVIDFIYFSLIDFPIFNVADMYVTCSVFTLIALLIAYYKEEDLNRLRIFKKKG